MQSVTTTSPTEAGSKVVASVHRDGDTFDLRKLSPSSLWLSGKAELIANQLSGYHHRYYILRVWSIRNIRYHLAILVFHAGVRS